MSSAEIIHTTAHEGPHIPGIVGETIFQNGPIHITTTVFSTWIFMVFLFIAVAIFYAAIKSKNPSKIKTLGLDAVKRLDDFFTETVGKKKYARLYFPML